MITSYFYSMSVKELFTRLSVLLVMCAFAVSAKAFVAQPTYMDGEIGYVIKLEKQADKLNAGLAETATFNDPDMIATGPSGFEGEDPLYKQGVYRDTSTGNLFLRYQTPSGTPGDVWLSEIKKLKLYTSDGVELKDGSFREIVTNFPNLTYLDLENVKAAERISSTSTAAVDGNPLRHFKGSNLNTLVFPAIDGLVCPGNLFNGTNSPNLKTVIFPDLGEPDISTSAGGSTETPKYYIADGAFAGSNVERVSLGYGFTDKKGTNEQGNPAEFGTMMFSNCQSLETVVLNNYITSLPSQAFEYCYSLEYVDLPMYLSHLGGLCFKRSGIRTVTLPDYIKITGSSDQAFQECYNLADIYVNTDNVVVASQGLMENDQTDIKFDEIEDGILDRKDYVNNSNQYSGHKYGGRPNKDEIDNSRTGQVVTVLHYPGTLTSIANYRVPAYLHYHGTDDGTGTTWPTAEDLEHIQNGWNSQEYLDANGITWSGAIYNYNPQEWPGYNSNTAPENYTENNPNSWYSGFKQFKLGNQNIKEQDVFYENRIKEARWYTVCYPMDLTKSQFETAYGIGADLRKFSGAEYDASKNAVVLQFNDQETEDGDGIFLKRNVPYMVHPARLNYREEKILNKVVVDGQFVGYEYEKEKIYINGVEYTRDKSQQVLAFYNIKSDLFAKKKADGSDDEDAIQDAIDATESKLDEMMVSQHCNGVDKNMDFTYRGNYQIETKNGGTKGKKIPAGAFYLGMWPGEPETLGFYKSDGSVSWPQYVAAILPGTKSDNTSGSSTSQGDAGAKLDVSFFGEDVVDVTTEIIDAPQIQINIIKASDKVYNMNGQMVLDNAKDMKSLPKGIYIVNGRKIAVK